MNKHMVYIIVVLLLVLCHAGMAGAAAYAGATATPNNKQMPASQLNAIAEGSAETSNPLQHIIQLAAGGLHTCALTTDGGVKCWGDNTFGQLGDGTTDQRSAPVDVSGLGSGVIALAAGYNPTCAVTATGGARCWGDNGLGQLGDGTTSDRSTPVDVTGLAGGVVALTAGESYTCALLTGGRVKCWGWDGYGQLGQGGMAQRLMRPAASSCSWTPPARMPAFT